MRSPEGRALERSPEWRCRCGKWKYAEAGAEKKAEQTERSELETQKRNMAAAEKADAAEAAVAKCRTCSQICQKEVGDSDEITFYIIFN